MARLPAEAIPDPGQILLISGPSGSGKTSLLRLLLDQCADVELATVDTLTLPDRPAADLWAPNAPEHDPTAPDADEAIARLSHVGLSDAYTWARTPDELSEGQRHRLALADAIWSSAEVIVADDWLCPLDSLTARAVAWRTGRALRDLGLGAILVTPRADVELDLMPDIHAHCGWSADPWIVHARYDREQSTIRDEVVYRPSTQADWRSLRHLHYISGDPRAIRSVHKLTHPAMDHPAAVAVLTYPELANAARNTATADRYNTGHAREDTKRLNREVAAVARIVVSPEVRGCGLAAELLDQIAAHEPCVYLELTAQMTRYLPFVEGCGFRRVPKPHDPAMDAWQSVVAREGWDNDPPRGPEALQKAADALPEKRRDAARMAAWALWYRAVGYRRTKRKPPRRRPNTTDRRWAEVWPYAHARLIGQPIYAIRGPLTTPPGSAATPQPDARASADT